MYWAGLLFLFLFVALNFYSGYDWINYRLAFENAQAGDLVSATYMLYFGNIGFNAIMAAAKFMGSYGYVYLISAIIIIYGVHRFCMSFESRNLALLMCFGFFGYYYFVERIKQGVAIAIILWAYSCFRQQEKKTFTALVFVAALFHPSALAALFMLWMKNDKRAGNNTLFYSLVFLAISYLLILSVIYFPSAWLSIPVLSFYINRYVNQITKSNVALDYLVSVGGASYILVIAYLYYVSLKLRNTRMPQYAFAVYSFSYLDGTFYGVLRVMNYFFPVVIDVLVSHAESLRMNDVRRLAVIMIAVVQILRPFATRIYADSIMDYQIRGLTSRTAMEMRSIRCVDLLKYSKKPKGPGLAYRFAYSTCR